MREEYNKLSEIFDPMYIQIITMNTMELPEGTDIINLYADYQDLADLICQMNPSQVYVVHAADGEKGLINERLNPNLKRMIYMENQAVYEII